MMKTTTQRIAHCFPRFAAGCIALAAAAAAQATDLPLNANAGWQSFAVDDFLSESFDTRWIDDAGSALNFTFSVAPGTVGILTIVDGSFAGDTFSITNFGNAFGTTSTVPVGTYENAIDAGYDFDAALANPAFSRGVFTLAAGSYSISGSLLQSVTLGGAPLNATSGALRLDVSPVPEPASYALCLAGLGLIGLAIRRRQAR